MKKYYRDVDRRCIDHQRYKKVFNDVVSILRVGRPVIVPVLGPTQCGKSTLCANVVNEDLESILGPRKRSNVLVPIDRALVTEISASPSDKSIYRAILEAGGAIWRHQETADELSIRTARFIKEKAIDLIVLDEFNHLIEAQARIKPRRAMDQLKVLFEETKCTFILTGLPSVANLIQINEQLRDRCVKIQWLGPYDWRKMDDREGFYAAFIAIIGSVGLEDSMTEDEEQDMVARLYGITMGRVGLMDRIIGDWIATTDPSDIEAGFDLHSLRKVVEKFVELMPFNRTCLDDEPPSDDMLEQIHAHFVSGTDYPFIKQTPNDLV